MFKHIFSRRRFLALAGAIVGSSALPAQASFRSAEPGVPSGQIGDDEIVLPEPVLDGAVSLEKALSLRRSIREYTEAPLTLEEISQLLWAAQGITSEEGKRTAPSAWAGYALDVFFVSGEYCYLYNAESHALKLHMTGEGNNLQNRLHAASGQQHIKVAPGVFVFAMVAKRIRFNQEFGVQETGHAAQNLLLQAAALGLGGVVCGSFAKEDVQAHLALEGGQYPVTLIPVGHTAQ